MIKKNGGIFGRNPTFKDVTVEGTLSTPGGAIASGASLIKDTDDTLAANSDLRVATQKAVKTYIDARVTGLLDFKGTLDCSGNPNYPTALKGDAYLVSGSGKVGGASGVVVFTGDLIVASADNAGGTQASVGASWFVLERNLDGPLLAANNLSDLANASTARSNLGLGTLATQAANNVAITGGSISGITDLAIADGGTGASTQQAAINALVGAVTAARFLRGDGTNVTMSAIQASDVPTLNQDTTGTSTTALNLKSNATTGLVQVVGPSAGTTRVMTVPNANFTAARTDVGQTFTGDQVLAGGLTFNAADITTARAIQTSDAASANTTTANLTLKAGTSKAGSGLGVAAGSTTVTGGDASKTAASNGGGGALIIRGGTILDGGVTGAGSTEGGGGGGSVTINGGDNAYSGNSSSSAGGVTLRGGNLSLYAASNGNAGNVTIAGGAVTTNGFGFGGTAGSIVLQTAGATRWTVNPTGNLVAGSSGLGIDFSVTSQAGGMTSELLSDYEEGAWTPVPAGDAGSAGALAYTSAGKYVKVGQHVTLTGWVSLTNKGSYTGRFYIGGIPYAASLIASRGSVFVQNVTPGFTVYTCTCQLGSVSYTALYFDYSISASGGTSINCSELSNTSAFSFTITYLTP